jgi:hypothetical protein
MESRSPVPSPVEPSRHHHLDMIDATGNIRLIRSKPAGAWHVVARDGDRVTVTACNVELPTKSEQQTIPVDHLLSAGRICLDCAQALLSAG